MEKHSVTSQLSSTYSAHHCHAQHIGTKSIHIFVDILAEKFGPYKIHVCYSALFFILCVQKFDALINTGKLSDVHFYKVKQYGHMPGQMLGPGV